MFTYTVLALKVAFLTPLTQYTASLECALVLQHQWGWVRAAPSVGCCQLHLLCGHVLHVGRGHCEYVPQPRSTGYVGALVLAGTGTGAPSLAHRCWPQLWCTAALCVAVFSVGLGGTLLAPESCGTPLLSTHPGGVQVLSPMLPAVGSRCQLPFTVLASA